MSEELVKFDAVFKGFQKAIMRLDEVLKEHKTMIVRNSAIKRFEFTLDLSWKTVKAFLEENNGIMCRSPKECFRQAFLQKFIEYDDFWMQMVDLRNETVHMYKEDIAENPYKELKNCLKKFKELESFFKKYK